MIAGVAVLGSCSARPASRASLGVGFCFSAISRFLKIGEVAQLRIAHMFAFRLYTGERLVGRMCIRKNLCEFGYGA
jgi:hypothetical protein